MASKIANLDSNELISLFNQTRDYDLYELITLRHTPLVGSVAIRFINSKEPLEDLIQEGWIGFIEAIARFDPKRNTEFSTYATWLVAGQIMHYLRDRGGRIIRVPAWVQELSKKIDKKVDLLEQELGHAVNLEDLLYRFPKDRGQIVKGWGLTPSNSRVVSLEELLEGDACDALQGTYMSEDDATIVKLQSHADLIGALDQLEPTQRTVIKLFYYEELTLTEIARRMGISGKHAGCLRVMGISQLQQLLLQEENN